LARAELKFRTLVVIATDGIGSCKSNYHTITTTRAPQASVMKNVFTVIHVRRYRVRVRIIVYNTTFNNISVILWQSVFWWRKLEKTMQEHVSAEIV
jgi:hypothetical protein